MNEIPAFLKNAIDQRFDLNSSKIKSWFLQTIIKFWELCSPKQICPKKQKVILKKDTLRISEAVVRRCSVKKVSLKISQKSLFVCNI